MLGMRGRSWDRPCGCSGHLLVVSTTQDDALQNEMELVFPFFFLNFFNFMQLKGLDERPQRAAAHSCFLGKMKNTVSLTRAVEMKALGDRGSLCF